MANNPTEFQKAKKDFKSGDAEALKNDAKQFAARTRDEALDTFGKLKNKFEDRFEGAEETAREYGEQIREKANDVVEYIEREARSNPLKVAAIAFITGVVAAALLGRRN